MKVKVYSADNGSISYWLWCPGCSDAHRINQTWQFNGDTEKPTFEPSILVTSGHYEPGFVQGHDCWCSYNEKHPDKPSRFECHRCHSFLRDGMWQFLSDCSHALAGQTVPMIDLPGWLEEQ